MERLWNLLTFLAATLAPSLAIIGYFLFYRPVRSCQEFMYGKYAVHWTCIAASLAGFCTSPLTLLWPSEFARTGITWLIGLCIGFCVASLLVAIVHIPVLHYNRSSTIYHYLEDRFGSKLLRYCTFVFSTLIGMIFSCSVLVFSAELAHRSLAVTSIARYAHRWVCILSLSVLISACSVVGGQKAASFLTCFTVLFEFLIALICALAMNIFGPERGPAYTMSMADDNKDTKDVHNRTNSSIQYSWDWLSYLIPNMGITAQRDAFFEQQNLWLTSFASTLYFFYVLGCHQVSHQHYCSVPSKRQARLVLIGTVLINVITWSLSIVLVCFMITYYAPGSTHSMGNCSSSNWLTDPYTSLRQFFTWPHVNGAGSTGYVLASFTCVCAFCCLPSSFVSLATSTYEDLVKSCCINAQEGKRLFTLKCLTLSFASLITIAALLASELLLGNEGRGEWWMYAKNFYLTIATWMMPFAGLYVLAIWLPCTNSRGAIVGLACGMTITVTLSCLHLVQFPFDTGIQRPNSLLVACCDQGGIGKETRWNQSSSASNTTIAFGTFKAAKPMESDGGSPSIGLVCSHYESLRLANDGKPATSMWYRIPLLVQAIIGFFSTILIGLCISVITGRQDIYALDWNLVYWTCNHLDGVRLWDCFIRGPGRALDGNSDGSSGKTKRYNQGPYTTSESFRYSKQGPLPDTSYLNPKVKDYMATLTRNDRS